MNTVSSTPVGITTTTGPGRIVGSTPDGYRLVRKQSGELVLQGAYMWRQGREYGHDWRDIPTVDEL